MVHTPVVGSDIIFTEIYTISSGMGGSEGREMKSI